MPHVKIRHYPGVPDAVLRRIYNSFGSLIAEALGNTGEQFKPSAVKIEFDEGDSERDQVDYILSVRIRIDPFDTAVVARPIAINTIISRTLMAFPRLKGGLLVDIEIRDSVRGRG